MRVTGSGVHRALSAKGVPRAFLRRPFCTVINNACDYTATIETLSLVREPRGTNAQYFSAFAIGMAQRFILRGAHLLHCTDYGLTFAHDSGRVQ